MPLLYCFQSCARYPLTHAFCFRRCRDSIISFWCWHLDISGSFSSVLFFIPSRETLCSPTQFSVGTASFSPSLNSRPGTRWKNALFSLLTRPRIVDCFHIEMHTGGGREMQRWRGVEWGWMDVVELLEKKEKSAEAHLSAFQSPSALHWHVSSTDGKSALLYESVFRLTTCERFSVFPPPIPCDIFW